MNTSDAIGFSATVLQWSALDERERRIALRRPPLARSEELRNTVARIITQVRADGDSALRALTRRFDGCELERFEVAVDEFTAAAERLDPATRQAMKPTRASMRFTARRRRRRCASKRRLVSYANGSSDRSSASVCTYLPAALRCPRRR